MGQQGRSDMEGGREGGECCPLWDAVGLQEGIRSVDIKMQTN